MAEPAIDFSPLASEGLREDLPNYQRKWTTLTNVIFKDGRLRPRPGLKIPWHVRDRHFPSSARGIPLVIAEIHNPGNTTSGRGPTYAEEVLTPTASADGDVTGWSGNYTAIDENPPTGSDHMTTSTDGAQTRISFGNLSNSPTIIPGVPSSPGCGPTPSPPARL